MIRGELRTPLSINLLTRNFIFAHDLVLVRAHSNILEPFFGSHTHYVYRNALVKG